MGVSSLSSLRRYDNDYNSTYERRTSYTPSHYSTSGYASSSYGTLPRYNRSKTPNYMGRERNFVSNREYKSMSRFSTDRESSESDDNAKQRLEKINNRYVRDYQNVSNNHSTNDTKFSEEDDDDDDDEEIEEEFSVDENEFKDVLRDIAKLTEHICQRFKIFIIQI
uniref:t-SNARE coiled-coil homology domain-containing protein n=1 Tax=Loa loa TaxID=7209 RepID=A0A1I7VGN1_LOALO